MIDRASDDDHPVDVILVHSLSRFFRDAFVLEMYVRKLAKCGVRLASIAQELWRRSHASHDATNHRPLLDEYQSKENGKHVLRAMKENARQGYYNGSPKPLGYTTEVAETRGDRVMKKLVVDVVEAETVKLIYKLYRLGDGRSGPLGLKTTACWLNKRGYRTRRGARFGLGTNHSILTNSVYVGKSIFNKRCSKTLLEKPASEHIVVDVPPIIAQDEFDAVAATLRTRDPRVTAPRTITGPILLTGLAHCATCGGAMTLRTGTSKSGAVHKYYTCSTCARKGKTACKGRSIPMGKLDALVTDHLVDRLFHPERLTAILASVAARRAERANQIDKRIATLQTEVAEAEEKLRRLYKMVEDGVTEIDEILKDRLASSQSSTGTGRDPLWTDPVNKRPSSADRTRGDRAVWSDHEGKCHLRRHPVSEGVHPVGRRSDRGRRQRNPRSRHKATLEQAIAGRAVGSAGVRSFERKWRARRDSNPRPPDS